MRCALSNSERCGHPLGKKTTAVVFLSARCPCSVSHEVKLNQLHKEFPEVTFVGIHSNADEERSLGSSHFKASGLPFPVLRDHGSALANRFGALTPPIYSSST